ncbi:MAG TPA: DUF4157 domain-containing protein [Blastocatellia bacterium]|nr:DUF4157 domain-containing protein [Blastocatellia bacterium]
MSEDEKRKRPEEESTVQMKSEEGQLCKHCEQERDIQAKEDAGQTSTTASGVESQIESMRGGGEPLQEEMRQDFEGKFGHDFSQVRVHKNAQAADSARNINARAYTTGQDVVFGAGEYSPETTEGKRLLAHELTHVVQQSAATPFVGRALKPAPEITSSSSPAIQREGESDAGASGAESDKSVNKAKYGISLSGNDAILFSGIEFPPDKTALQGVVEEVMATRGTEAANKIFDNLISKASIVSAERTDRSGVDEDTDLLNKLVERLNTITANLSEVRTEVNNARKDFIRDFETQAKANVGETLNTSEDTAKREAVNYGITEEQISKWLYGHGMAVKTQETKYHMQTGTPVASGLQKAAGVLLARQQKIAKLERDQRSATRWERDSWDPKARILVPDEPKYSQLALQVKQEREQYEQIRSAVTGEYPVLAAVSELDKSTSQLETISKKGGGDETAQIIGAQIAERLANITKVRANLNDKSEINIWRLQPVVDVTSVQLGAPASAIKKRWVSEQVEEEKPGMLGSIALLIFNLLAIALAPATGGISLAVAAGVNAVATAIEVKEYMMQKAMANTDFDKAKSISQEDPSLFWLAVSIVGTVIDVGTAAATLLKTFRALAPLAKAAEVAKSAKEAEAATEALAMAARKAGGEKLAEKVVANARRAQAGESLALEAAGATKAEREALESATKAAKSEVADLIGAPIRSAGGDVKLSKAGHLFSCTNPCPMLREKYLAALAKDPELEKELAKLEKRALDAAAEAKRGGPKADKLAEAVKNDAAALESKIRKAHPNLAPASAIEDPAALQKIKLVEAEGASAGKRIKPGELTAPPPKKPDSIKPNDPLWKEYEDYYATRYSALKAEEKAGAAASKYPLEWGEYQNFRSKFLQGRAFQVNWAEMAEQELTIPVKGQSRARITGMTDTEVTLKVKSKSASGDITLTMKKAEFEKWVSEGKVIKWSLARQRLMGSRPPYRAGLVEEVWANAQKNGKVLDPNTGKELFWDAAKNRWDQWHMGHKPGKEYSKLVDSFIDGERTWDDFLKEYNNPANYWPEDPLSNIGHAHEL